MGAAAVMTVVGLVQAVLSFAGPSGVAAPGSNGRAWTRMPSEPAPSAPGQQLLLAHMYLSMFQFAVHGLFACLLLSNHGVLHVFHDGSMISAITRCVCFNVGTGLNWCNFVEQV